ncbi:MAG: DNA replication/repair protein RecF [Gammaproteobacteria bacterium]|nr:DNA replication/repair protein RecF [Gammaproteobacteria bacterium]
MSLQSLDICQFRNLHQVNINTDAGLNIITGLNAAGKTSLLEAIFYLSYGRSFRSSQTRDLIENHQDFFRLVSKIKSSQRIHTLGIQKSTKDQTIRIDQQNISSLSELSTLLPVIALHPDSHQLIAAGPEFRRQYLDWGVFHVEHAFIKSWKDYRKALSQRNAALRTNQPDKICSLWHQAISENAEKINLYRLAYLEQLEQSLDLISSTLFENNRVGLEYKRGWSDEMDYQGYLEHNLQKDREKGFTQAGPHRADLKIRLDDKSAQTSISRGQQKKLVTLLKLAQLDVFVKNSDKTCILLFDDLPAELDRANRRILMEMLSSINVQLFVTAIEVEQLDCSAWDHYKRFHVEHGVISEI